MPTSNALTFFFTCAYNMVAYQVDPGINVNDCVHTSGSKLCLKEQANTIMDTN